MRRLTPTELHVARLVAEGRTNPGVAKALGVDVKTVEQHLSELYRKLGVRTRRELERVCRELEATSQRQGSLAQEVLKGGKR